MNIALRVLFLLVCAVCEAADLSAQIRLSFKEMASLPTSSGWAGMFAGSSHGAIFCMGGTNFPDSPPWEGGRKKWYGDIYMFKNDNAWIKLNAKMPVPLAYGVSISYKDRIITVGGCNEDGLSAEVTGYYWDGRNIQVSRYPSLHRPMAYMTGALVNSLIVIAGGSFSLTGDAIKKCFVLDIENTQNGWIEIGAWPGTERMFSQCASYNGNFFLFGGETTELNSKGIASRRILQDAYKLSISRSGIGYDALWKKLSPMPIGLCSGPGPLPVMENGEMIFWGGVDALAAMHTNPLVYPGNNDNIIMYSSDLDKWTYVQKKDDIPARADLPAVYWRKQWVFISGEIKPGVRTNTVFAMRENIQHSN